MKDGAKMLAPGVDLKKPKRSPVTPEGNLCIAQTAENLLPAINNSVAPAA